MSGDEIAVALAAILLGSAIKSISGMGLPLVSIPIISFVTDLETAVAAVAIPNLLINVAMAWRSRESSRDPGPSGVGGDRHRRRHRRHVRPRVVRRGTARRPLIAVVAIYVITFGDAGLRSRLRPRDEPPSVGLATGLLQGAIGISGPLIGSWVHATDSNAAHIFSITTLFALAGAAQLVALLIAGELSSRWTVAVLGCLRACHGPVWRAPSQPVQLGRVRPLCRRDDRSDRDRLAIRTFA